MKRFSVTCLLQQYHIFDRDFWLDYKALESIIPEEQFSAIKIKLMRSGKVMGTLIPDKEQFQIKRTEIDQEWKQKTEQAKLDGIKIHEMLQQAVTSDPIYCKNVFGLPIDNLQIVGDTQILEKDGIYTECKMEFPIDDYGIIVGIADVIIKQGNKIKIIDYKTSDKIEKKARYDMKMKHKKTFSYPINSIEDCNFNSYTLQLSIYAWILQQLNPTFEIESLEIYHIRNNKLVKIYQTEYWKDVVDKLIRWHVKKTRVSEEMQRCQTIYYDAEL